MRTNSALSYFGSDSEVAERLAKPLDSVSHVTIPFVGGGSIIPYLKAKAIVCNDLNSEVYTFYQCAKGSLGSDQQEKLFARCRATISHPTELAVASEILGEFAEQKTDYENLWQVAWAYWASCWVGRKGHGGSEKLSGSVSYRSRADGGNNASRLASVKHDLTEWLKQIERCEFRCVDFRRCLDGVSDSSDCGMYIDPPFVVKARKYKHDFEYEDHIHLANRLNAFSKCKIVVRYGDHQLIRDLYKGWQFVELASRNQSNVDKPELMLIKNV